MNLMEMNDRNSSERQVPRTIARDEIEMNDPGQHKRFRGSRRRHAALDGRLTMTDIETGKRFNYVGGFGKWLLPGDQRDVIFRMPQRIPSAQYELKIVLRCRVPQDVEALLVVSLFLGWLSTVRQNQLQLLQTLSTVLKR